MESLITDSILEFAKANPDLAGWLFIATYVVKWWAKQKVFYNDQKLMTAAVLEIQHQLELYQAKTDMRLDQQSENIHSVEEKTEKTRAEVIQLRREIDREVLN